MLPDIGTSRPWADPSVVALSRLPMHVPLPAAPGRVQELAGEWLFQLFASPDDVPQEAVLGALPEEGQGWRPIAVPGVWPMQRTGDPPHYTNVQMPFPGPPPRLPERNPTGVYRREIRIDESDLLGPVVLWVGGADAVHAVYLNGRLVGYGTDARLASEYDVTAVLLPGLNELAVVVVRYAAHSYVEDQDAWWLAGLHRGVRLEHRGLVGVRDVRVTADFDPQTRLGSIEATVVTDLGPRPSAGFRVRSWVESESESESGERIGPAVEATVPHEDARPYEFAGFVASVEHRELAIDPWSAELPRLYTLRVELVDPHGAVVDATSQRIGFRRVRVEGNRLLVNGERIWVFGVNRHDHHPDRGSAVTADDLREDLITMRRHNVNAIRTSHYPNDDAFYALCDELGFYVIDEANIEAHAYNRSLCDDPAYRSTWLERGARMVERDRNHPSVVMWSLGNESGYGANHDALAAWIRRTDSSRPLHYEDAIRIEGWESGGRRATDVVCPMYPTIEEIREYGLGTALGHGDRPLIMCEYSHAMGNSNGSLADYWDVILSTPGLQGGFLWEWKDQGLRQSLADGRTRLAYGGQFGEEPHDGNFVADGLVSADGVPHPAMAEVAWVHRPVHVELAGGGLLLSSLRSFVTTADLSCTWQLLVDGAVTATGRLEVSPLAPGEQRRVPLPVDVPSSGDARLTTIWSTTADTWFAAAGRALAWDQVLLREERSQRPPVPMQAAPELTDDPLSPARLSLWRAATDNDGIKAMVDGIADLGLGGGALSRWRAAGLDSPSAGSLVQHGVEQRRTARGLEVRHVIDVPAGLDDLARVGVVIEVDPRFDRLRWCGRGPHENYPDRNRSALVGTWSAEVEECPYLVPQEFGLRTDTTWLELLDPASGDTVRFVSLAAPFHWSATRHRADELFAAANDSDLVPAGRLIVHLDAAHRGVGTGACGPDVLEKYRIGPGRYELGYLLTTARGPS